MDSQESNTVTEKVLENGDVKRTHTSKVNLSKLIETAEKAPYSLVAFQVASDKEWEIVSAPVNRDWMEAHNGHAYRCLPLTIANASGWIIKCPVAFTAIWNGGLNKEDITIYMEDPLGEHRRSILSHFGSGVLTFQLPWVFQTNKPGLSLSVRGLPNYFKRNINPCEGIVEIDWLPFTFTMNWKIMDPNIPISFAKGDPICFIQPIQLNTIEAANPSKEPIEIFPDLHSKYLEWEKKRSTFNRTPRPDNKEWQKFYHNGMPREDGTTVEPPAHHRTALKLKPFTRRKDV